MRQRVSSNSIPSLFPQRNLATGSPAVPRRSKANATKRISMIFHYTLRFPKGYVHEGSIDALDREAAAEMVRAIHPNGEIVNMVASQSCLPIREQGHRANGQSLTEVSSRGVDNTVGQKMKHRILIAPPRAADVARPSVTPLLKRGPQQHNDLDLRRNPPSRLPSTAVSSVSRIIRAVIGFVVGAGLTLAIVFAIFDGINSATGRHFYPRGKGWGFLIIGAGVGCAGLFMLFDRKFFQALPLQARVMIVAPISWVILVLSFVLVFQPFGGGVSDAEKWLVAKIVVSPIVAGFLAYFVYRRPAGW